MSHDAILQPHRQVLATIEMTVVSSGSEAAVVAHWKYETSDPFAVAVALSVAGSAPVAWRFGRDLLLHGIHMTAGIGDVRVMALADVVVIELRTVIGTALLFAERRAMSDFIARTLEVVPVGHERSYCDLDRELAAIISVDRLTPGIGQPSDPEPDTS